MSTTSISPSALLRDLDELWRSLGKADDSGGGPGGAVLRACAMTLIVIAEDNGGDGVEFNETLAHLMRDHPSRLIVLRLADSGEPRLEAGVTAQCWMPFGKRQQICCEQIVISASLASLAEVPPVIRSLIVPDLPVACWIAGKKLQDAPELEPLIALIDKLVIDSGGVADVVRQIAFIRQAGQGPRRVGDLAWTRLTRWREAIAQIFDDPGYLAKVPRLESVRIEYQGAHAPISAYYLAAWLQHCTGRKLAASFQCIGPAERARVQSVALGGAGLDFSITVGADRAVEMHSAVRDAHSVFPRLTDYELLREELGVLGPDPVYEAVILLVSDFVSTGA